MYTNRKENGGGLGEKEKRIKMYKVVVTEQSWGCEIQYREYNRGYRGINGDKK